MIWLAITLGCAALAIVLAVACVIDGQRRDRYAARRPDPAIELEAMAHRWATEPTRKQDT